MREKYEGQFDSRLTAFVYDNVVLQSGEDDSLSNEPDGGWSCLVGRRIITGQSSGFVYMTDMGNVESARAVFDVMARDPYYADDDE
jgi:hypothetical protein